MGRRGSSSPIPVMSGRRPTSRGVSAERGGLTEEGKAMLGARAGFDRSLRALEDEVLVLGSLVDKAVGRSIAALQTLDREEARAIIEFDDTIDRKQIAIENRAIELIATQQPMARDLRRIVAVLHIIMELERIGDYAEGNAKIVLLHGDQPLLKPLIDIPRM